MRARISYVSCLLATLAGLSLAGGQRSAKAGQEPPTEERPAEPVQPGEGDDARDELVRRLRGGDEADSVFARVLRGMDQSYRQLAGRLDAGEQTQHVQTQIMADLDEAIATARRMQSSGQRTGQRLDARRAGKRRPEDGQQNADRSARADSTAAAADATGSSAQGRAGGGLRETGRGWGDLPERDREAVIQGMQDQHRRTYDELIRRYYEALAETGRER